MRKDRVSLEAKRAEIKAQMEQFAANVHACEGAIQLLDELLREPDAAEPPAETVKGPHGIARAV